MAARPGWWQYFPIGSAANVHFRWIVYAPAISCWPNLPAMEAMPRAIERLEDHGRPRLCGARLCMRYLQTAGKPCNRKSAGHAHFCPSLRGIPPYSGSVSETLVSATELCADDSARRPNRLLRGACRVLEQLMSHRWPNGEKARILACLEQFLLHDDGQQRRLRSVGGALRCRRTRRRFALHSRF